MSGVRNKKKENIKDKLFNFFAESRETVFTSSFISIVGEKELLVENHKGILAFNDGMIRIRTTQGVLQIMGKHVLIEHINKDSILITGTLDQIEFM